MRVHFILKIEETLMKDPHKVWQTLTKFEEPSDIRMNTAPLLRLGGF